MLKLLRTMDEVDRRRLVHMLLWVVAVVVLTLGSEFSHWWRHSRPSVLAAAVRSAQQGRPHAH